MITIGRNMQECLGAKTEVHQQTTYTGHRLAPWLGHVMVADQESSRPLMDAAEICKMPATDAIIFVAGFPPFLAKRLKYYEDPLLAARAALPALPLKAGGPYLYRPPQVLNPWAGKVQTCPLPVAAPPTSEGGGGGPERGDEEQPIRTQSVAERESSRKANRAPTELQTNLTLALDDEEQLHQAKGKRLRIPF